MDVRLTWTDCDEAGDYVVPIVLSPRNLVSRSDNMNETVLHTHILRYLSKKIKNAKLMCVAISLRSVISDRSH